ncbi:peptide deformylase [Candidatus Vidania fulgoroideorum]
MFILYPDKTLKKKSKTNKAFNSSLYEIIKIMIKKIINVSDYIAISAVQIGYLLRIFIVKYFFKKAFFIFINPKILWRSSLYFFSYEGCISIPKFYTYILRNKYIIVETYCNKKFYYKFYLKNLISYVFQHEYDHLNGKLIKV